MFRRACVVFVAISLLPGCGGPGASATRPDVVLVTIDTLRADRVGCYGDVRAATPTLDALCAEGLRFDPAIAPSPLTLPSHATILTGLEPPAHGVRANGAFVLPEEHLTIAQRLGDAGYATAAFVGAFPLDRRFGLGRGFQHYDDRMPADAARGFHYAERPASAVMDAAIAWLDARRPDVPVLLWVHVFDPHEPYEPPPEHLARAGGDPYRGEIAYVDAQLARLFGRLKAGGRWDRTLVVVTADHGESLGEHGEPTHGFFAYDATLRVPLIVKPADAGRRGDGGPARLSDIAPTVLRQAGLAHAAEGHDLIAAGNHEPAYAESMAPQLDYNWSPLYVLRGREWKYIQAPEPELYDLVRDPGELRNLASEDPGRARSMRDRLEQVRRALDSDATQRAARSIDPIAQERLASLGYSTGAATALDRPAGADPKHMLPLALEIDAVSSVPPERLAEAVGPLEALAARDPHNNLIQRRLGTACERAGDWACAARAWTRAVALGYDTPEIRRAAAAHHVRYAIGQDELGRQAAAGEGFEAAVSLAGDSLSFEARGTWHARHGRMKEAHADFDRARALEPSRWQPHYQLGLIALQQRRAGEAATHLREARRLAGRNPDVLFALSEALRRADRRADSDAVWEAFLAASARDDPRRRIAR